MVVVCVCGGEEGGERRREGREGGGRGRGGRRLHRVQPSLRGNRHGPQQLVNSPGRQSTLNTDDLTHVFVDTRQQMHLLEVTERLGVRLPASPPPWASTSKWTEAEKCCKTAAKPPLLST